MNKDKFSALQLGSMLTFCIISPILGISSYNVIKLAEVDLIPAIIIGFLIGIIPLLMYFYINNYKKELAIHELTIKIFGKPIGIIVNTLLLIFASIIASTFMFDLVTFITTQFLSETPFLLIGILFSLVVIYAIHKGIETISRVSLILITINAILFLIAVFGLFQSAQLDNLKPYLEYGLTRPFKGGIHVLLINIVPLFLLTMISKNEITDQKKIKKNIILAYLFSFIICFGVGFFTMSVLGINLAKIFQYPEYIVLKKVNLFEFLDRIENLVSMQWMFGLFMIITISSYFIFKMIRKDDNKKKTNIFITSIIVLAILFVPLYFFKSHTMFNNFTYNILPIINLVTLGIFVLITITIFIRKILKIDEKEKIKS